MPAPPPALARFPIKLTANSYARMLRRPMAVKQAPRQARCMPSPRVLIGRRSIIGNVYALTLLCRNRQRIFDSHMQADVATQLIRALDNEGLTCSLAWVVMPDHIHWLAQLRGQSLGYCVQRFKARSSFLLNRRRGRCGPVWQAGYYEHAVRADDSLRKQALYIMANPVRAGLAAQLGEYPYAWCRWPLDASEEPPL